MSVSIPVSIYRTWLSGEPLSIDDAERLLMALHSENLRLGGSLARAAVASPDLDDTIQIEQETDGRWIAEVPNRPGVMAYGTTQSEAIMKVQALLHEMGP